MKTKILYIFFVILISSCSHSEKQPIDNEYFLVGTLSDYMGREHYKEISNRVDRYKQSEKQLCLSIDSILQKGYSDLEYSSKKHKITNRDEFELHSELLAGRIREFYNYKPSGRKNIDKSLKRTLDSLIAQIPPKKNPKVYTLGEKNNKIDTSELSPQEKQISELIREADTIYCGSLKPEVFRTPLEKISFITGAYIRFGSQKDSVYCISIANSVSKVRELNRLLRELGCSNVRYEVKKDYIPVGKRVYFMPTEELIEYFDKYIVLRQNTR